MNRRELLKGFAAAGVVLGSSVTAAKQLPKAITAIPPVETDAIKELIDAADSITLDLNKMAVISINAQMDNNVVHHHSVGSFETTPALGLCHRHIEVHCYVDDTVRRLFDELQNHKVHVIYRQAKHPCAEVKDTDPVLIDSMACLSAIEMTVTGAHFDVEAHLVLDLIQ